MAKNKWEGRDPSTVLHTEEGHLDMQGYSDALKEKFNKGKYRGKLIHAILQLYISPEKRDEVQEKIQEYLDLGGLKIEHYDWVTENAVDILRSAGINSFDRGVKEEDKDKLTTEYTVGSDLLGVAGTIDLFIKHADGKLSLVDFKTGYNFDRLSPHLLKYFHTDTRDLTASQKDLADLQLMWYAFIYRLNNPDARFRELRVR